MKTRLSYFLCGLLITAGFASCKKDPVVEEPKPTPPELQLVEYKNGAESFKFNYDQAGRLQSILLSTQEFTSGIPTEYALTYNSSGQVESATNNKAETIRPEYEEGRVFRANLLRNNERYGYANYYYENNRLAEIAVYYGKTPNYEPALSVHYTYDAQGRLTEITKLRATDRPGYLRRSGHVTMTYDKEVNPLARYRELLQLFWVVPPSNNVEVETQFNANLQVASQSIYTYTYNSMNLPAEASVSVAVTGQPPVSATATFLYQ